MLRSDLPPLSCGICGSERLTLVGWTALSPPSSKSLPNPSGPRQRSRSIPAGPISRVGELALAQRQATATDAFRKARRQAFEFGDAHIDLMLPAAGESGPVRACWNLMTRQLAELPRDLLERQSDTLREHDERHAAQHRAWVTTVPGGTPLGLNQSPLFVEPQR